jgi:VCBS repeat-containing protein
LTVNTDTGLVTGTVAVDNPEGKNLTFTVTGIDPAVGTVVVNAQTGTWAFQPTTSSQLSAWFTPQSDTASFTVTASDGTQSTPIAIAAPVTPAADLSYDQVFEGAGNYPTGIAVSGDGHLYIASYGADDEDFTLSTLTVMNPDGTIDRAIHLDFNPWAIALGADNRIYVSSVLGNAVYTIDPANGDEVAAFAGVPGAAALAFDQHGHLYVGSVDGDTVVVLDSDGSVLDSFDVGGNPWGFAFDRQGRLLAAVENNVVDGGTLVIRDADGAIQRIDLGAMLPSGVSFGSDGRAYVMGTRAYGDDTAIITVVDLEQGAVANTLVTGPSPMWGITTGPGGLIYVTDTRDSTANVISIVPVEASPYGYLDVDPATGAVSGYVSVLSPNPLSYSVTQIPAVATGSVSIDPLTGNWVFTPTRQARLGAYDSAERVWVSFAIAASDGDATTTVTVKAWIEPAALIDAEHLSAEVSVTPNPIGVAVGADGRIYVTGTDLEDPIHGTLTIISPGGSSQVVELGGPVGQLAISPDGRLFVAGPTANTVSVLDAADGYSMSTFATVANLTGALAFDSTGRLYVAGIGSLNASGQPTSGRITVLNSDGTVYRTLDLGQHVPNDIAIGADGQIFVTSTHVEPDAGGEGQLIVLNQDGSTARVITLDGDIVDIDTKQPGAPASYDNYGPHNAQGVAVGPDGVIYVTDEIYSQVLVIDPSGFDATIPLRVRGFDIAVGADGRIVVANTYDGTITVLSGVLAQNGPYRDPNVAGTNVRNFPGFINGYEWGGADRDTGEAKGQLVLDDPDYDRTLSYALYTPSEHDGLSLSDQLGYSPVTLDPSLGYVVVDPNGSWWFHPTLQARLNAANTPGEDTVSFTIVGRAGTDAAAVTITLPLQPETVPQLGAPPFVITNINHATGLVTGTVNVTDVDGDSLSYYSPEAINFPSAVGRLTVNQWEGTFTFAPTAASRQNAWNTAGADSITFSIVATDGETAPVTSNLRVPIDPATIPVVGSPSYTITTVDTSTGVVRGRVTVTDADGDALRYGLDLSFAQSTTRTVNSGTITVDQSGNFVFTPNTLARSAAATASSARSVSFTVFANDAQTLVSVAVTAPIVPPPAPPKPPAAKPTGGGSSHGGSTTAAGSTRIGSTIGGSGSNRGGSDSNPGDVLARALENAVSVLSAVADDLIKPTDADWGALINASPEIGKLIKQAIPLVTGVIDLIQAGFDISSGHQVTGPLKLASGLLSTAAGIAVFLPFVPGALPFSGVAKGSSLGIDVLVMALNVANPKL